MASPSEKVVQTTLGSEEYERLRGVAERGKSLKQVLFCDALNEYVDSHYAVEPEDPLFVAVTFEGEEKDAAETDRYLYD